jgi:hypothetical protein
VYVCVCARVVPFPLDDDFDLFSDLQDIFPQEITNHSLPSQASDCILSHNKQLGIGAWHTGSKVMLLRCVAEQNGRTGLASRMGSTIAVVESLLKGNQQFGVYVSGGSSLVTLLGCTSSGNGLYGLVSHSFAKDPSPVQPFVIAQALRT